ncbi:SDR family NAD(P)-dependent oxidoreductase [Draconibacterium sediminis]|uniref:3-oxoacyl-ACP reductase n=1 Tax=Draconibacterium sediminis TaxID=1544798 RepID=A0A0D8JAE7_9BACT|nr:SDR family oxidoreductase [Draconibacterium sediminis]KJF43506.1 3-oxoacyl-ACP reductase [Draconibacterium sediminis]
MKRVALVTGASKGIGKVIAIKLAELGFNIMIVGRNKDQLTLVKDEIERRNVSCAITSADLSESNAPAYVVNETIRMLGKLDVLINNAGLAGSMPVSETSVELWDLLFKVNARAPYFICKEAVPFLKASHNPVIINIGSVVDFKGYINQSAYASSKHALAGFTKVLAKEVQNDGIKVHLISPGGVNTEMVSEMRPDINTDELIKPEEIAELVEFLVTRKGKGTIDHFYIRRQSGLAFD